MAFSNLQNYVDTRILLIEDALSLLGVNASGRSLTADEYSFCSRFLNRLQKRLQAKGITEWQTSQAILFPQMEQQVYQIGNNYTNGGDNCASVIWQTSVATAGAVGDSTIAAVSVAGSTVGDNIGVIDSTGAIEWFTVSSINTGTNTFTISGTLAQIVPVGSNVFGYTTQIAPMLKVLSVRRYDLVSNSEIVINGLSNDEYFGLPNQTNLSPNTGDVIQYYYQKLVQNGLFYVWPVPANIHYYLKITYQQSVFDLDADQQNPDFPQEFSTALIYNLAMDVAPKFGATDKAAKLAPQALAYMAEALEFSQGMGSYFLQSSEPGEVF